MPQSSRDLLQARAAHGEVGPGSVPEVVEAEVRDNCERLRREPDEARRVRLGVLGRQDESSFARRMCSRRSPKSSFFRMPE
jgi:hypothetical protein